MKKTSLYDNSSGYGHGGLGYDQSLDTLPMRGRPSAEVPGWLPWAGLAGAGVLGYAGLKGLSKVFRRGAPGAVATKAIEPAAAYEREMLGRVNPKFERMGQNAEEAMAAQKARRAHEESLKMYMDPRVGGAYKTSALITALGHIARGD